MIDHPLVGQEVEFVDVPAWRVDDGADHEVTLAGTFAVLDFEPEDREAGIFGSWFLLGDAPASDDATAPLYGIDAFTLAHVAEHGTVQCTGERRCGQCAVEILPDGWDEQS